MHLWTWRTCITFLLYIGNFIEPIQKLTHMTEQFQEGITGFERFMEILEVEPEIQDSADAIEMKNVQGNVEFRNVGFRYRDDHAHVLKNISLEVKRRRLYCAGGIFRRRQNNSLFPDPPLL